MGGQDSQQSSHHFCCLGETSCQVGKKPFYGFLWTSLVAYFMAQQGYLGVKLQGI